MLYRSSKCGACRKMRRCVRGWASSRAEPDQNTSGDIFIRRGACKRCGQRRILRFCSESQNSGQQHQRKKTSVHKSPRQGSSCRETTNNLRLLPIEASSEYGTTSLDLEVRGSFL